jgi:hypothetical protein
MDASPHPAASHHLPIFITAPGQTDVLMVIMGVVLVLAVLGFGILFFRLHSLPERIAHRSHKFQMEIVAILCLISLFTHMHIFWIIGLLLAVIDLPDFGTPLGRIAGSVEKIAGVEPGEGADTIASEPAVETLHEPRTDERIPSEVGMGAKRREEIAAKSRPELAAARK